MTMTSLRSLFQRLLSLVHRKRTHPGHGQCTIEIGGKLPLAGRYECKFEIQALNNRGRFERGMPAVEMTPRRWMLLRCLQAARDRRLDEIEQRPLV